MAEGADPRREHAWLRALLNVAADNGLRYVYTIHRAGEGGDESAEVIGVLVAPERLPNDIEAGAGFVLPEIN